MNINEYSSALDFLPYPRLWMAPILLRLPDEFQKIEQIQFNLKSCVIIR